VRRIFIGDIQGCVQQLDELLAALQVRADDRLYAVGDLVSRGPDSPGVLRRARALNMRAVLGNHDMHLLRMADGTRRPSSTDRLHAVLSAPDCDELLDWLREQPVLIVEGDLITVHGGVHPAWSDVARVAADINAGVAAHIRGEQDERITFATQVRYCDAEGRRPLRDDPPPGPPFFPWDHFYRGARTVVFGHWARRRLVMQPRLRGLDTGCVYGGALTAWIAEEDRLVQVPGWHERVA
jgi:bis(5'-nucleosyl)-tetraphosphatase (symmetrical)